MDSASYVWGLEIGRPIGAWKRRDKDAPATSSGLQDMTLQEGSGKSPKATGKVRCHHERMLIGEKLSDSSLQRHTDFPLDGAVAGESESPRLTKGGAKCRLLVPCLPGDGTGNAVPSYSPLTFDVELIKTF